MVTHDLVHLLARDKFLWIGRADQVINSGGIKIHPERIENMVHHFFESHQIKKRFFVAGVPDVVLGQKVVLIVEGGLDPVTEGTLQKEFQIQLSKFEIPQRIVSSGQFKETATQKIDRIGTLNKLKDSGI